MDINKHVHWDLPSGSVAKNLPANAGDAEDVSLIPGSGRSPGEGNGNPLKYSCLENPMDRGAWQATVQQGHKEPDTTDTTSLACTEVVMSFYHKVLSFFSFSTFGKWSHAIFFL